MSQLPDPPDDPSSPEDSSNPRPHTAASPDPGAPEVQPPAPARSRFARFYASLVLFCLLATAGYLLLQKLWGEGDSTSWDFYLGGVAAGCISLIGVRIVRARLSAMGPADRGPGFVAWCGFPAATFGLLAMVPLLVLSISPPVRQWLIPRDTITASIRRSPRRLLVITFPQPLDTRDDGSPPLNLSLDDFSLPADYARKNPGVVRWVDLETPGDHRRLLIDLEALAREFPDLASPERVRINGILDRPQIVDASGQRFTQRSISLE